MIFLELYFSFFLIGLFTFGGGYAMIPLIEKTVISKNWISGDMFYNFIAISEMTPGPFAINISTFVGFNQGGVFGAICSTLGVVSPCIIIIVLIAALLKKFMKNKYVSGALNGVKPVVFALISSVIISMILKTIFFKGELTPQSFYFDRKSFFTLVSILSIYLIYKKIGNIKIHPILLILFSALFGIIIF